MPSVDLKLLKEYIERSGYKSSYIAGFLGISRPSLFNKMHDKTQFTVNEIYKLSILLNLTNEDIINIFFKSKVSNTHIVNIL